MENSHPHSSPDAQIEESPLAGEKLPKLFLEGIVSFSQLPYYWGWAVLSAVIFLGVSVAIFYFERAFKYIIPLFILAILTVLQPSVVIWAHRKMSLLRDYLLDIVDLPGIDINDWYDRQMAVIFDEKRMVASGFLVNIIYHAFSGDDFGFVLQSPYSYAIIYIDYFFTHFFMGVGLYTLLCTALMVNKITKLPMNINVLLSRNLQVKGLLYSKFTILASCVYALWGLFRLSTPAGLSSWQSKIIYSFFALLILAYFILPQYSIHQMIIKTKKEKLDLFSKRTMAMAEEAFAMPNKESILNLRTYLDIEQQLDEMCVWPFGSYEILHIVLIVIIPFVVVLLEIMLGIIK
jgi:hypothetical protein